MTLPADLPSLQPLLGSLPVPIVAVDAAGAVFVWNEHAATMYGWSAAEALGRPISELVTLAANRESPDVIMRLLRGGYGWEGECRLRRRGGDEITVHLIDTPLFDADGNPSGYLAMAVDVTSDRQGPIAVLEAVVNHSPISVTVVGADDRIVLTMGDPRTDGDTKSTFVGRKISDLIPDASYLAMVNRVRMGERGRQTVTYGGRTYDTTGVPVPDAVAGPGGAAFVATDVTERATESRRFQALVENLQEVTAIVDADGSLMYISPAVERVTGYTPDELMRDPSMGTVHPDDAATLAESFRSALEQPTVTFHQAYRVRHRDGGWRDLEQTIVNRLDDPAIGGLLAVGRDVTDRVAAENGLRDANHRLSDINQDLIALGRVHAVLSKAGNAMVRATDPMALLEEVCRILVETGDFATAAVTTAPSADGQVLVLAQRPQADLSDVLAAEMMEAVVETVRAGWPTGQAAPSPRGGKPRRASAVVLLPLERRDDPPGLLAIHPMPGRAPVTASERALLLGLGRDLAFALDSVSGDSKRVEALAVAARRAQQQSIVSRLGSRAMVADAGEVLEAAVAGLASFDLRHVILYELLPDQDAVLVRAIAGQHLPLARGDLVPRTAVPIIDAVFSSGEGVTVDDLSSREQFPMPRETLFGRVGSAVGIPIRVKGETVAALLVRSFAANVFDVHDVAFYESVANVVSGAIERRAYEADLRHDATHDRLTGLPNRVLLQDRLAQALARCRRRRTGHVAVLVADVDALKTVNDRVGRDGGDTLLALAGGRLVEATRPSDTVAHSAGDEFVVLCEDLVDPGEAASVAARISERMGEPFLIDGREISITLSVGIAVGSAEATVEGLLRDAAVAMYRAKERGRNRYELFDEALRSQVSHRADLELGLQHAVQRDELVVAYQPVVDMVTGAVNEAEALLRWTRADGTQVAPTEFIPIAEETGLIVAIGAWVIKRACEDAVRWNHHFSADAAVSVAVNLSARQISQPDLVPTVRRVLETTGLPPHLLRLEITETSLMEEGDEGIATLRALDDLGVHLSVDDFGTGYSSLMYLRRYPVRVLKVDRYFVAGLGKNSEDEAIVEAVIALAHALGLVATAEGVETVEQLARLRELACDYGQGYLWSRAVPFAEFIPLVTALRTSADPGERAVGVHTTPVLAIVPRVSPDASCSVVLVDDSPSDRGLLRHALEESGAFIIVGEAGDGEGAIDVAAATQPDVLVLDMSMTGMNGLEAVAPIHLASPATRVVFLSGFLSGPLAQAAIHAGAYMNFDKSVPFDMVVAQLSAALVADRGRPRLPAPRLVEPGPR